MSTITEILAGAEGLQGVQQLLSANAIKATLLSMLQQPAMLHGCHLRRAKFKPGRKLTAYYDLAIADATQPTGDRVCYPIAVTWTLPGAQQPLTGEECALEREINRRGLAEPFQRLIHAEPDANIHIQVSPLDADYPQLARLTDPTYLRTVLRDHGIESAQWRVTPIRYRPRQRHVLRYAASDNGGNGSCQTLFAKLYRNTEPAPLSVLTHELADWLAATTAETTVLRPLVYLPADTTMLYAAVQGRPLAEALGGPLTGATAKQLRQTGAALRALHSAPTALTKSLPTLDIAKERKAITRTCEHIQALLPRTGQTIQTLLAQAADGYEILPQEAPTFVHGDFKADHVLVQNDRLTLIDFDSSVLADPAHDIGKFLADLAWWYSSAETFSGKFYDAAQPAALAQARNAFLTGYGLSLDHPRLQRAQIWEALIGIKIIAHRVPIFDVAWATHTATAVERVERQMIASVRSSCAS